MPEFTATDWYRFPYYYDIVFDPDSPKEAGFLEAVLTRHGPRMRRQAARVLEPACGNGRLVVEFARRGHQVTGFDLSDEMLAFARERTRREPAAVRRRCRLVKARMESFRLPGRFHLAHCILSTFKYLLTEEHARAHLQRVARALVPGGLYVVGLHFTDYARRTNDREVWRGTRDGVQVHCETVTRPAERAQRLEWLRNRLTVRRRGTRAVERLETLWPVRTYDATELGALLASVPALELVACYDFTHDITAPREFDDAQEDIVLVLRKR